MRCAQLVIALVAGCGRIAFSSEGVDGDADGPDASPLGFDAMGHWVATSAHETGAGTRMRSDLVNGVRGDLWFVPGGTYRARLLRLANSAPVDTSVLGGRIDTGDQEVVLHLDDGQQVSVYAVDITDADHVRMTWRPEDPRNIGTPVDDIIDLARTPDMPAELIGSRVVSRMAFPHIPEFAAGTCLDLTTESDRITGTSTVDENFMIATTLQFQTYPPSTCTGTSTDDTTLSTTFLDRDETSYLMWTLVGANTVRMRGDFTITPTAIRFERSQCVLDLTECENDITLLEVPR